MASELTRTAAALHEVPIAAMVKATVLGLIEAQYELDMNMIELAVKMGDYENHGVKIGKDGKPRSLLELGFTPTMYQFKEAVITLTIDITVAESEAFKVSPTISF